MSTFTNGGYAYSHAIETDRYVPQGSDADNEPIDAALDLLDEPCGPLLDDDLLAALPANAVLEPGRAKELRARIERAA